MFTSKDKKTEFFCKKLVQRFKVEKPKALMFALVSTLKLYVETLKGISYEEGFSLDFHFIKYFLSSYKHFFVKILVFPFLTML